jgi:hypothetical protein
MDGEVTLYSLDGDGIALIHFCPTNNQPRMRFVPAGDNIKELTFDFQGAGNLSFPTAGHQHHLVIRLDDADHITETWTWRQDGKDMPMIYHLARTKPQASRRRSLGQTDPSAWVRTGRTQNCPRCRVLLDVPPT